MATTDVEKLTTSKWPAGPGPAPDSHPPGFWFFFWGEFAERCSYYGMRAILPLYMTAKLRMPDDQAAEWYSFFKAACYLLPLVGGFLADRYFGKYWTIVGFSAPYVIGQFLIGIEDQLTLVLALILLASGSGVIKPNISSLMGLTYDQQRPGRPQLRARAFLWFYFSINVGSTISMVGLPIVRNHFGYQVAFLLPAVLMVMALAIFALGKRYYANESVESAPAHSVKLRQRVEQLGPLYLIFGIMVFFWVAYEHNDSIWVFFVRDHVNRRLPGWLGGGEFAPDQLQFVNAALILALVPFSQWFWPKVDLTGRRFPATTKMLLGFLFSAGAPATLAFAARLAQPGSPAPLAWVMLAYLLLTIGEVLVYGTGLDLSYACAPADMKGFVTACFLLTSAVGNLINTVFSPLYVTRLAPVNFFLADVAVVLVAAVAFYFAGRRFNSRHAPANL